MSCFRFSLVSAFVFAVIPVAPSYAGLLYGSSLNNYDVLSFDTTDTRTLISDYPLSGPRPAGISDDIVGFAMRSELGQLYGMSGTGIYKIDPNTGVKTLSVRSPLTIPADFPTGTSFEPGTGNLFFTTYDTKALLEVNVDTGVTTKLGPLLFASTMRMRGRTPG